MKQVKNYNAFDIVALITVLLDNDSKYIMNYTADNSQIIITRQDIIKKDK